MLQKQALYGRDLAGDAIVAPEVRAVGERLVVDLDQPVVEKFARQRVAGLKFVGEKDRFLPPTSMPTESALRIMPVLWRPPTVEILISPAAFTDAPGGA